jgi:Na+-driven multidrug efflux pump
MVHLFGARANFDYRLWRVRWSFHGVNSIFKTGAPSFLSEASFSVALLFMNRVVGSLAGETGLAAVGIMFAIIEFIYNVMYGVAVTMQPIISFNHGANAHSRVWDTLRLAIRISFLIGLGLTVAGLFGAEFLVRLINGDDPLLVQMATKLVRYNFLTMPIAGIATNIQIFYQSISRARIATALTVIRNGVFVIGVLYLMRALFGIEGVWLTYPIADVLSSLFMLSAISN